MATIYAHPGTGAYSATLTQFWSHRVVPDVALKLSAIVVYDNHSETGSWAPRVYNASGTLVASGDLVARGSNGYLTLPLTSEVVLDAGATYYIGFWGEGTHRYLSSPTYPHSHSADGLSVSLTGAYTSGSDNFPTNSQSYEYDMGLVVTAANAAPNAPILTAPADGATIDRNSTQRFDWDFSDSDAGDSQSKYDLRYRVVGNATWTTVTDTTPNTYWDAVAGTFAAGDYEWQVRTYDAQGVVGPYSGSSFFTAGTAPSTPSITDPVNGATVGSTQSVTWSAPDQDAYQIRRVADSAGTADTATVYYDSGEVTSTTARTASLTFETNDRYEHIQVRIKDNGLWSSWASIRVLVSYTPPPTPVVTLTPDEAAGSLLVGITNPAPGAGEPALAYNDIYVDDGDGEERRVTGVLANGSWIYWLPKSGRDYNGAIRVVAVATNGTTSSS